MNPKRNWDDFVRFGRLLLKQQWIYAKTMPQNPHCYTLRKHWGADSDFVWAVEYLRANGYAAYYRKARYIQINVNEHFYWTMGAPIPATILINRKAIASDPANTRDVVASQLDCLRHSREVINQNRAVFDCIGSLAGKDVLEVGCGKGLTLDSVGRELDVSRYLGIDPSPLMLCKLRRHHSDAQTIETVLYDFVAPLNRRNADGKYDVILVLFGIGSHLMAEELRRIPRLIRTGGRAAVTFHRAGYEPKLDMGVVYPLITPWQGQFPGTPHIMGNNVLVIYDG